MDLLRCFLSMLSGKHTYSARHWRVKALPPLGLFILGRYLIFARGVHTNLGYRLFFGAMLALLYFWWRMDRKDLRHLEEEERKAADEPKHLFDHSVGMRVNYSERRGMLLSLALMGVGLLFQAFISLHFAMIFWGASCVLIAAAILVLT